LSGGVIELWDISVLNITTPNNLTFSGQITGATGTKILKPSTGTLTLSGNNSNFKGLFSQTNGTTTVAGNYFTGKSSISANSVLELSTGTVLSGGVIELWDRGELNITTPNNLTFSGQISGTVGTKILKPSTGTLTLSGDNKGFEGVFKQTAGTTIASTETYLFKGEHVIETSELQVTLQENETLDTLREIEYKVAISTGGVLLHFSNINDESSTKITPNIRFIGDNGSAIFYGNYMGGTWYVLEQEAENLGTHNTMYFDTCYIDIASDTYRSSMTYIFIDSVIDIDYLENLKNSEAVQVSTRMIVFDNLETEGSIVNTTIIMTTATASGSQLKVTNKPPNNYINVVKLGIVTVGDLTGETGHIDAHSVRSLDGHIIFDTSSYSTVATMAYEYSITVDTGDQHCLIVDANKVSSDKSLNNMNGKPGNRALNFTYDETTEIYCPFESLSDMSSGTFVVLGKDSFNGESSILAVSTTTNEKVSLFKVTQYDTDFQIRAVQLIGASGEHGAALSVTTNTAKVEAEKVTFSSNTATSVGGGAIYASSGTNIVLRGTRFLGNSAESSEAQVRGIDSKTGNGGAINIDRATVTLSGILEVVGNSASGNGGAIYVNNGVLNVGVDTTSAKIFQGNTANGVSNAIYLAGNSQVNFGSAGGEQGLVNMYDAIGCSGNTGQVNINGETIFNLQTSGEVETIIPNLNINNQSQFNIVGETEFRTSNNLRVDANAALKIEGSAGYGKEIFIGNTFSQNGLVQMNLFGENMATARHAVTLANDNEIGHDLGNSDLINVDGGTINLSVSSKLSLNTNDAFDNLETFKWKAFKLMKYGQSGTCTGEFGAVVLNGTLPKNYLLRYDYLGQYVALLAEGYATGNPKFSALDLCFNQTQTAETLDYFCNEAYSGEPGSAAGSLSGDAKKLGDNLQNFMDMLGDGIDDGGSGKDISGLKDVLFDLSGYFISNVIIGRAYDGAKTDVYNRIYNYKEYEEPTKGIWAQVKGASIYTDKDIESPHKFKVTNIDLLAGFDMMTSSTVMAGAYVKQDNTSISQGSDLHKGDVSSVGLGLYGGRVKEKYDIKALVSCNADNYETTRCLRFENRTKVKGKFSGVSAILDAEAGYRIGIGSSSVFGNIKLRPYVGAALALIHTNGFTETGSDIWNLEVKANNYLKAGLVGGICFTGNGKRFRWNASCGLDCILTGRKEEITSKFMGGYSLPNGVGNRDFRSRSATLDVINIVSDVGFGYYILDELEVYCSCDTRLAKMVKDFCANIGVRYSFGKWIDKKVSKSKVETVVEKKVAEVETGNEKIKQFRINAVLFEFDKADIKTEAEKEIRELAKKIGNEYKFEKIRIEGHTDSHGSDEYNRKLSLARAHAVHDIFVKYGIDVAKIEKIGHGESKPIDTNENEKGRANNRRVEIFIDLY
jgi:predicted outer membrane repeat protein